MVCFPNADLPCIIHSPHFRARWGSARRRERRRGKGTLDFTKMDDLVSCQRKTTRASSQRSICLTTDVDDKPLVSNGHPQAVLGSPDEPGDGAHPGRQLCHVQPQLSQRMETHRLIQSVFVSSTTETPLAEHEFGADRPHR